MGSRSKGLKFRFGVKDLGFGTLILGFRLRVFFEGSRLSASTISASGFDVVGLWFGLLRLLRFWASLGHGSSRESDSRGHTP